MTQHVKKSGPILTGDVLILEDEPLMTALLKRYISGLEQGEEKQRLIDAPPKLRLHTLESGFNLLETDLSSFQVAVVDILLPQVTGVDLVRHFRRSFPNLGIVAISGMATDPMKRSLKELLPPEMSFLAKPLRKEDFFDAFIKAWNYRGQQQPPQSLSLNEEEGGELWTEVRPKQNENTVQVEKRGLLRKRLAA